MAQWEQPRIEAIGECTEGVSGPHFQMDLCSPQNGEIPSYKRDAGRQCSGFGWCSWRPVQPAADATGQWRSTALSTKCTGPGTLFNQKSETWETDSHIHLNEWDLDSEPG